MGSMVHTIMMWLTELGYWGILIGLMIEIIPSEIVLAYAGFLVSQGQLSFVWAVIYGVIGGTLAQVFLYWLGKYGGRPFLSKYGKYLLIHEKHLEVAEHWFERYGSGVIVTARFVPVVRHAISIPAGIARMSLFRFSLYTALAIVPWSAFFILLGSKLGQHWQRVHSAARPYVQALLWAAALMVVVYLFWKWAARKKD